MYILIILFFTVMMSQETKEETAVFGGGCFWCTEAVFNAIEGVNSIEPGYSGGHVINPSYREVCSGETGHAEVIKINYDPRKVSFAKLLEVFFMTHDPTTLNRQGADVGTQYRSVVFYNSQAQKEQTEEIIKALDKQAVYDNVIVTELSPLENFYQAEEYHFDYYERNKKQPYCRFVIQPKIEKFKKLFEDIAEH